jgi:hypothetical protein
MEDLLFSILKIVGLIFAALVLLLIGASAIGFFTKNDKEQ